MVGRSELAQVEVRSAKELRAWLRSNHRQEIGIWLVTFKKPSEFNVPYEKIVDEALCFGWVDSQPRALDAGRSMRLLSPRRRGSSWSKVNKRKVELLIASGRMTNAGLVVIERAKQDGSWSALDKVEQIEIPADLASALSQNQQARENFDAFPRSSKRLILEWIAGAKRPETRAKRVTETVEEASVNRRAHHARQIAGAKE